MTNNDSSALKPANPRVGLFVTCLIDLYRPNAGFAAVKLLEAAGCTVEVPEAQTCCGQPAMNSGDYGTSREIARQVIEAFADYDYLVAASGSCMGTVTYHDSCSGLRELGIKQQPRKLLGSIDGLEIREADNSEICCGFGGTFCVKYPEISTRLVTDKVEGIEKTGAATLLGGDMGCLLNMSGRLMRLGKPMRVYHVAEVLAGMADLPGIGDGEN